MTNSKALSCFGALLALLAQQASADTYNWVPTGPGPYNWADTTSNWTSGFPNAAGDVANFNVDIAADQTIQLNQAITVGSLILNDSGGGTDRSYIIDGGTGGSLTFQVASGNATLTSNSSANAWGTGSSINSAVNFASATTVNVATNVFFSLMGPLSGSVDVTKSGGGLLRLGGDNSAFTGNWILNGNNQNGGLQVSADNNFGAVPVSPTSNIILQNTNAINFSSTFTMNANRTITINSGTFGYAGGGGSVVTTIDGLITGAGGLSMRGNGGATLILTNNNNDFAGNVAMVSDQNLRISSLAMAGQASQIGAGSAIEFGNAIYGGGGRVFYTGGAVTTDRRLIMNSSRGNTIAGFENNGTGAVTFTDTSNVNTTVATADSRRLILGGSNTGDNVFSQLLNQNGTEVVNFDKTGAGTWTLANTGSTYNGTTSVLGGVLNVKRIAASGVASSIGAGPAVNAASGLIISNGTLRYSGTEAAVTNRLVQIGHSAFSGQTGTIDASGTAGASLKFTKTDDVGAVGFTNPGNGYTRTLVLRGTNTDDNTMGLDIGNNGSAAVSVNKQDGGVWILSGNNTYTGATTVSAGVLRINGTQGNSAVTVAAGAELGGSGLINGAVVVNGGITPGNSIGTLTVNNDLTWNGTDGQAWKFELGETSGSNDQLLLTGTTSNFLKGTGSNFQFDFLNTGSTGTFTLVDWDDAAASTFTDPSIFTYSHLGDGLEGSFAMNGSQLDFTVVPEANACTLLALGMCVGVAGYRRRRRC